MANTFISGTRGSVLIGTQNFAVTQFQYTWEVQTEDITHSQANGQMVILDTVESATGTLSFVYDTSNKPTVAPNQLKPRTQAVLHLKPDGTDDFNQNVMFTKIEFSSGPKAGAVNVTVDWKSNWTSVNPITYPTS